MAAHLQYVFPVVALSLLAGGSIWLERVTRAPRDAYLAVAGGPDVVVDLMALTRFDINGEPHYYLDARRVTHLPGEENSQLEDPVVHYTRENMRVRLAADAGVARDDGERVDLAGTVRGERELPGRPVSYFASDSLVIWPNVEAAKSTDPVVLTQNGAEVRGSGMTADNIFGLITLTGRVNANMPVNRNSP